MFRYNSKSGEKPIKNRNRNSKNSFFKLDYINLEDKMNKNLFNNCKINSNYLGNKTVYSNIKVKGKEEVNFNRLDTKITEWIDIFKSGIKVDKPTENDEDEENK